MQTLLLEFFVLLPFLSGPAAMHIVAEKRKLAFTICDKVICGALLGNFSLIVTSILVGLTSNFLTGLFGIYTLLSLFVLALFTFQVLRKRKRRLLQNIKFSTLKLKIYAFPILLFALFGLFLHSLYLEYDAIYTFFPYAKSIVLTGTMRYNVYDQSTLSTGMPPVLPILYAWAFSTVGDLNAIGVYNDLRLYDVFRPIPVAYFLLTALVVYVIAREALQKEFALLSVIIFMSFPSVILTLSAFTYYLDLGFVFYLTSAMLLLIKALRTQKPIWFLLTGVASSLLLLTKELSVFVVPAILSMFILFSSIRYRRVVFVILSTSPFYLVFFLDMYGFSISAIGWILVRQLPVFALSIVLYYLSGALKRWDGLVSRKNLFLFLIPFIPSVAFFLRGIVFLGSLYSIWGPALNDPAYLFQVATGTTQKAVSLIDFFRWDIPFISLGLGVSYLIPILYSIVCLCRRKHQEEKPVNLLMLIMLFFLLETMAFTLVGSQAESRRMYYFAPMLAIFAAKGVVFFGVSLKGKFLIYFCMLFNSLVIGYFWLYKFPFQTLLGLSYLKKSFGSASSLDLLFLSVIFICIFLVLPFIQKRLRVGDSVHSEVKIRTRKRVSAFPYELENTRVNEPMHSEVRVRVRKRELASLVEQEMLPFRNHRGLKTRFHMRRRITYLFLLAFSCLLAMYPAIPLWLEGVSEGFFGLQHDVYQPTWEAGILTVSYYYAGYVDDHYVTVSFGGGALRYFANRSLIDVSTLCGIQSVYDLLVVNEREPLLLALRESEIRYFLIPTRNNTFFELFSAFRENFYLFQFVEEDENSLLIKKFDYFELYKLDLL